MKEPEKLTKKERIDWTLLIDAMSKVEYDLLHPILRDGCIPPEWISIAREGATPAKTRITARFDADVVRFFRSLGTGYQEKMNRVLKSWMLMRMVGLVEGRESDEIVKDLLKYRNPRRKRPELGEIRRVLDQGRS
ncbi:MAG: BrnA antitoxin family protein [Alphaproteobacteria bacterium]|nr:BrnA antitoxin family protein [Alphaproteobacteria bacterium]